MNAKKILVTVLGLTLTVSAFAASTTGNSSQSTFSLSKLRKTIKNSPLSLGLLSATSLIRNEEDVSRFNGYSTTNYAFLNYKLTPTDTIKTENRWNTRKVRGTESDTQYRRLVVKYTRSGILNQKDHGINLSANIERRWYPNKKIRAANNVYGLNRVSLSGSRSLTSRLGVGGTLYYAQWDRKDKDVLTSSKSYVYGVFTQSYSLTRKAYVTLVEELFRDYKVGKGEVVGGKRVYGNESVDLTLEVGYNFSKDVAGSVSAGIPVMGAHDGRTFRKHLDEKISYGFDVYLQAF